MAAYLKERFFKGIRQEELLSYEDQCNLLFLRILTAGVLLIAINLLQDVFTEGFEIIALDLAMLIVALSCYLISYKQGFTLAKIIFISLITFVLFFLAAGTHSRNSLSALFISGIACSLLVFGKEKLSIGISLSLLNGGSLLYLELSDYDIAWVPSLGVPSKDPLAIIINVLSAILLQLYAVYSLIKINLDTERGLIQQQTKLVKINKELDRFVYTAAHDLRAPLRSLKGLLTLHTMESDTKINDQYLGMMQQSIDRMDDFIKDITELSRNAQVTSKPVIIALAPFIKEIFTNLQFSNGGNHIRLELKLLIDQITADEQRLNTIFSNLLGNAIKYHDPLKEDRWVRVSVMLVDRTYFISIEDNGHGIEGLHQEKIFDMFYRATSSAEGTGLGLYIVKEAVTSLHGQIKVRSKIKEGTLFEIVLPSSLGKDHSLS